jgi:DNA-binding NarL/FixJ family response regulator
MTIVPHGVTIALLPSDAIHRHNRVMSATQVSDSTLERSQWITEHMGAAAAEPSSLMTVLAAEEDWRMVEAIVAPCRWTVYRAVNCEEAIRFARYTRPRVLLCDAELPDGSWRRIWKALSIGSHPPLLVVASRNADERLWSQVLNAGGYDVLLKPFRPQEVVWAIHCAATQQECAVCHANPASAS